MTRAHALGRKKVGLRPGSVVHVGETKVDKVRLRFIDYDAESITEKQIEAIEDCFPLKDEPTVSWINIDGLHETDLIERLGRHFGLHPLLLEDVVNTNQRPKVDDYGDHVYVVLKMLLFDRETQQIEWEQFSLVLGHNFVISFQECYGDVFEAVRERLRRSRGKIRAAGADYLAYALIDAVIDNYFLAIEGAGEQVERLEEEIASEGETGATSLRDIYLLKRELIHLRRLVAPVRDVAGVLLREHSELIREETEPYLRDLYDHAIRVTELVDSYREMLIGLQDLHLSVVSNRMNEVMKVLTVFAAIFIPLTFIAGVYGMNFEHMPELKIPWAYPAVWAVMLATAGGLLVFFRLRRWL